MVFVVGNTGIRLMPTSEYRARKLMSRNRAVVYKHRPFTIQLLDCKSGGKQPVEYTSDVGSYEAGISVKSEKHAYREMQADMLPDEREKHNDRARYRRTRRNRKRHRKPRFDNRKKPKGWLPPSIRHKMEAQVRIFSDILEVCPITEAYFEMGKFDTQALKALEAGDPLPQGEDYQHGNVTGPIPCGKRSLPVTGTNACSAGAGSGKKRSCMYTTSGSGAATAATGCPTWALPASCATRRRNTSREGNCTV